MKKTVDAHRYFVAWPLLALLAMPVASFAQVAVAEFEELEEIPTISASEIDELVGPIALYPDDLLAIVLPAATYPLQIVEAARFLEALEQDASLEPDEDWDDSIVALLNYPEVIALMNEDLDWTWRLGEAVVSQQSDVIGAIETFRDRAYAAGNLESDDYQLVSHEGETIQITPVQDDVIYVPYYEPEEVVVYQPRRVYYYYPRPYPVYYYPYPSYYSFHNHFHRSWFWGVTTAFTIGWHSHHLNVYHHTFYGHPYYGHSYWDNWWYRRPDIHIYNNTYVRPNVTVTYNRYQQGDRWTPNTRRTVRSSDGRVTRTRYYPSSSSQPSVNTRTSSYTSTNRSGQVVRNVRDESHRDRQMADRRESIKFRERPSTTKTVSTPARSPSRSTSVRDREPRITTPGVQSRSSSTPRNSSPTRSSSPSRSASPPRSSTSRPSASPPRTSSSSRRSAAPKSATPAQRSSQRPTQAAPPRNTQRSSQRSSQASKQESRSSRNSSSSNRKSSKRER